MVNVQKVIQRVKLIDYANNNVMNNHITLIVKQVQHVLKIVMIKSMLIHTIIKMLLQRKFVVQHVHLQLKQIVLNLLRSAHKIILLVQQKSHYNTLYLVEHNVLLTVKI